MNTRILKYIRGATTLTLLYLFVISTHTTLSLLSNTLFSALLFAGILVSMTNFYTLFEKEKTEPQKVPNKHVALWDRTSVDLPQLSVLAEYEFVALYVCAPTTHNIDFSLIKLAGQITDIHCWEFDTTNPIDLKINLILTLHDIAKKYGDNTTIDVFTKDRDLAMRIKVQGLAYNLKDINTHKTGAL